MKLLIIGYPRSGKTTRARNMQITEMVPPNGETPVLSTDKLVAQYEWSAFSDKVCDMLKQPGPWIIEGCSAVRGLRKYLKEGNVPDFEIEWLDKPFVPLVGRQVGFAASLKSIWGECQGLMEDKKK
jgi:hypothetical protein